MFRQKKVVSILCALVMAFSCLLLMPLKANAYYYQAIYHHSEPATSDGNGWIALLLYDSARDFYTTRLYSFNTMAADEESAGYIPSMAGLNIYSDHFELAPYSLTIGEPTGFYSLFLLERGGGINFVKASATERANISWSAGGYQLVSYKVYGSAVVLHDSISHIAGDFSWTILFKGGDLANYYTELIYKQISQLSSNSSNGLSGVESAIDELYSLVGELKDNTEVKLDNLSEQLTHIKNYLNEMVSILNIQLGDINDELDRISEKLDKMVEEQQETNSWLEKIFNYLNESQEKQKQEAQAQGNSSTSQGMNSIEDKGAGFTDSLGGLVSSMSYTGTECAWNFPEIKLPAISGVMDEVTLMESQPIDFAVWVNAIPSNILIVVQSLLTIGLIVYCFKELYSTIAYVLTLRKDDNA